MKAYEQNDKCIQRTMLDPKSESTSVNADKTPSSQSGSNNRMKYALLDAAVMLLLGAGAFIYYSTAIDALSKDLPVLTTRLDIEAEVKDVNELEEESMEKLESEQRKQRERDAAASLKRKFIEAQRGTDLELQRDQEENVRLKKELNEQIRAMEERKADDLSSVSSSSSSVSLSSTPSLFEFLVGDVVELLPDSDMMSDSEANNYLHLLAPFRVDSSKLHMNNDGGLLYELSCAADGRRMTLPADHLRAYQVYEEGTEALCNMGNFRNADFFPCIVLSYKPNLIRGSTAGVLQSLYVVRVSVARLNSGDGPIEIPVPAWKMKRLI